MDLLDVLEAPYFVGTVLVSIPNDPDPFRGDVTSFKKLFIFVHLAHYMAKGTFFGDFKVKIVSTYISLHPSTGFNPLQGRQYSEITVSKSAAGQHHPVNHLPWQGDLGNFQIPNQLTLSNLKRQLHQESYD
jgi:hypothetical protein